MPKNWWKNATSFGLFFLVEEKFFFRRKKIQFFTLLNFNHQNCDFHNDFHRPVERERERRSQAVKSVENFGGKIIFHWKSLAIKMFGEFEN